MFWKKCNSFCILPLGLSGEEATGAGGGRNKAGPADGKHTCIVCQHGKLHNNQEHKNDIRPSPSSSGRSAMNFAYYLSDYAGKKQQLPASVAIK